MEELRAPRDQGAAELPLTLHELEAVSLERRTARAGRPQVLPPTNERGDAVVKLLDIGPDGVGHERRMR